MFPVPTGASSEQPLAELFIGRVPPGTSKEALEVHFAPYGANNVRVLDGKGCAFASFSSWGAAERAIQALNGLKLTDGPGEGINVKFAESKGGQKGRPQSPKVFIGGISSTITEETVSQMCQAYGVVTHAKIFAKSASSPPCAFVTFSTFGEAEECINALNGMQHPIAGDGKTLNVKLADNQPKAAASPSPRLPLPVLSLGSALASRPAAAAAAAAAVAAAAPRARASFSFPPPVASPVAAASAGPGVAGTGGVGAGPKVFIGGLPEVASEDFVWGMMAPFGEVVEAKIHRKPGALPCGFARFAQPGDAERAIAALGDLGRYPVKFADDGKPSGKRPFDAAFPGDAWTRLSR